MTSQLSCVRCFNDSKQVEFVVGKKIPIGMGAPKWGFILERLWLGFLLIRDLECCIIFFKLFGLGCEKLIFYYFCGEFISCAGKVVLRGKYEVMRSSNYIVIHYTFLRDIFWFVSVGNDYMHVGCMSQMKPPWNDQLNSMKGNWSQFNLWWPIDYIFLDR
jgi:hypothetical protein